MSSWGSGEHGAVHARLGAHDNALNAIRLVLAALVVVDHSFKVVDLQPGPWPYLGGFAVDGFFAISGYLIVASRMRMEWRPFLWRRALRLMPAYWTALAFTAFAVAPVSAAITRTAYDVESAVSYVLRNALLFTTQLGVGETPSHVAYEGLWNSPLWSLPYEAGAYLVFGLLVAMPGFGARAAATVSGVLGVGVVLVFGVFPNSGVNSELPRLWSYFAAGALLWFVRERLPRSAWFALGAAGVVTGAAFLERTAYLLVTPVPLAFLLLWLGARLPTRVGSRNDISYGVYVLAFPIQQVLVQLGLPAALGAFWFAVVCVAAVVPFAWASWLLVERPAMALRRRVPAVASPEAAARLRGQVAEPVAPSPGA